MTSPSTVLTLSWPGQEAEVRVPALGLTPVGKETSQLPFQGSVCSSVGQDGLGNPAGLFPQSEAGLAPSPGSPGGSGPATHPVSHFAHVSVLLLQPQLMPKAGPSLLG